MPTDPTRLNKYIANTGYCTRREAATLIKAGKVVVDGKVADNPGMPVDPTMVVTVEGRDIATYEPPEYYLINKPKQSSAIATDRDKGLIGLLKKTTARQLVVVHPMAINDTGLHVITNDGDLLHRLQQHAARIKCVYQLKAEPTITVDQITDWKDTLLQHGIALELIEDVYYDIGLEAAADPRPILEALCKAASKEILRLDRTYYAGLTKKDLPRGWSRALTPQEVIMLKHFT